MTKTPTNLLDTLTLLVRRDNPIDVKKWAKENNIPFDPEEWTTEQKVLFELTWG